MSSTATKVPVLPALDLREIEYIGSEAHSPGLEGLLPASAARGSALTLLVAKG